MEVSSDWWGYLWVLFFPLYIPFKIILIIFKLCLSQSLYPDALPARPSVAMCICWLATSLVIFDYVIKCPELHSLNTSLTIPVLTPTALCSPGRTAIIIRLSLSCFPHSFIVYREDVWYAPCKIFSVSFSLRVRRGNGGKKGFPLLDQRNYSRLEWGVLMS